jgi:hypothetical protein
MRSNRTIPGIILYSSLALLAPLAIYIDASERPPCARPCEFYTGEAYDLSRVELGSAWITPARDASWAPHILHVLRCMDPPDRRCPAGRENLAAFLDTRGRDEPAFPAAIHFAEDLCFRGSSLPLRVEISLVGHAFEFRLEAVDRHGRVFEVKGLPPHAVQRVEFAHADGIARVDVYGHEICVHGVCWGCEQPPRPQAAFVRADADASSVIDLSDGIFILNYLFLGGAPLPCADAGDVNDDGRVDLSDGIAVLGWLFLGSSTPPPPSPSAQSYAASDCRVDPTPDNLTCENFAPCEAPEPVYILDQLCEGSAIHSHGCGDLGRPLFQSFTCGGSNVGAVSLRLRPGGSFPAGGTTTTIRIRSGGPSGAVLATATAAVEPATSTSMGPTSTGAPWVRFEISPPLSTQPGDVLAIEWLSPAPAGAPAAAILSWLGDPNDPYPAGMAYSGCGGAPAPTPAIDHDFKTFVAVYP